MTVTGYFYNLLYHGFQCFSRLLNVVIGGNSNEDLSCRCYREGWIRGMKIVNALFFWQNHHCRGAYASARAWSKDVVDNWAERIPGSDLGK